jgi:alpha-D-ribose 1-methylphosphonate 5-triphosphate synthase subunit PhnH
MSHPVMSQSEARYHTTFQALMWALSHPGRPQRLPDKRMGALLAIGECLVDLETSFYTPSAELGRLLRHTGARELPAQAARYQFYPELTDADLVTLAGAPVGSYAAPDDSATLILGCAVGRGPWVRLSGPGINAATELRMGGLPTEFWSLRGDVIRYPLGWDVFLVAYDQVIGLPRTTQVQVIGDR